MKLTFLGATDTVTGSKYLLSSHNLNVLIDCGLYQGVKRLRERNWQPLPVDVASIDAVILTHAHIDHSGYLPALMKQGFNGPIYCSAGTQELCKILLPDAGYLQEEDARFALKHKFSKHHPPKALYTEQDARQVLTQIKSVAQHQFIHLTDHKNKPLKFMLTPVGHILGACAVHIDDGHKRLVFSGDIGRYNDAIMPQPEAIERADVMVVESTYGDKLHEDLDPKRLLGQIICDTLSRGGSVLIPAFAVGRAQLMLYYIKQLALAGAIPKVPVYLNSPMAISATDLYKKSNRQLKLTSQDCHEIDAMTTYVRTQEESVALNEKTFPSIIISASGMASGGRVVHHLKSLLPDHRNSIVFAGYQATGTRGQAIVAGAATTKIHGQEIPVKAQIHNVEGLSAHSDYSETIRWLSNLNEIPQQVYVTHGEETASDTMRKHLRDKFNCSVRVPELGETVKI